MMQTFSTTLHYTERPILSPSLITRTHHQIDNLAQEHPLISVITAIFFGILGLGTLISAPFISASLAAVVFATMGGAALVFSGSFAYSLIREYSYLLHAIAPERISFDALAYETKSCNGGSLNYINQVPVLKISAQEPEKRGFVQGYLTGKNIHQIFNRFLRPFSPYLFSDFNAYQKALQKVKSFRFTPEQEKEIEGIVSGFNQWRREEDQKKGLFIASRQLTADDVKVLHAFPDLLMRKTHPRQFSSSTVACLKNDGTYLASNFDCFSGNALGNETLVTVYQCPGKSKVAMIGFAGGLGIRGMNQYGLSAAINSAGHFYQDHQMPMYSLQRNLLEDCQNITNAKHFLNNCLPSSSHLLTLADENEACVTQWYPDKNTSRTEKLLNSQQFVVVTNHFESANHQAIQDSVMDPGSIKRLGILDEEMKKPTSPASSESEMLHSALKSVEMDDTVQSVIFCPNRREIHMSWDNCYAADLKLQKLTYADLFA